jgi:hypothetical protein
VDVFQGLAAFALGKLKQSLLGQWLKFLWALGFSGTLSFLFVCGSSLIASESPSISIGRGMVAASVVMTICYRMYKSKLLSGLPIVLPAAEAKVELGTDIQVIEKS